MNGEEPRAPRSRRPRPPRAARLLGAAGLLPPYAAIALVLSGGRPSFFDDLPLWLAAAAGLAYGALILSFLGGLWWGAAAARLSDSEMEPVLALSVLPSLVAFAALGIAALSPLLTGLVLAAGLLAALVVNRRLQRISVAPPWWMSLRTPLSLGLAAAMVALGWLLR